MNRIRTLLLAAVLGLSLLAVPHSAGAADLALLQAPDLRLPDLRPALAWDRGAGDVDTRQRAVAVEGDVDKAALLHTLERLHLRRQMLTVHQVLAWTAAWTIISAEVVGLVNRIAIRTGNIPRADLEPSLALHRVLAGTAIGTYWSAGIVAWTMPSPSGRAEHKSLSEWRTTRDRHIVLSIIHNIAMGVVTVTGILQANVLPPTAWDGVVTVHQTAGFVAGGFVLAAAIVISRL